MMCPAKNQFNDILSDCIARGGSDIHLSADQPVSYRINGRLQVQDTFCFNAEELESMAYELMNDTQWVEYEQKKNLDLGYSLGKGERFRLNIYRTMGATTMAIRHLNQHIQSLEELGLPPQLRELAYLKSGLVLVTGATGSGKSSTLAVLLDEINRERDCHILTIEDPVEFVHRNKRSLVHHREIHADVDSYADAVRAAMREDPDVIMVGEMRDKETMQASLSAAETGHLVFSTLHTGEAIGAIERFIGYFPGEEQGVARHRMAMVLKAVVAQRLVPDLSGEGRVAAIELLMVNTAALNLIRTSRSQQLYSLMESGGSSGMWTMDQALAQLVIDQKISFQTALGVCQNSEGFERFLKTAKGAAKRTEIKQYAC